MTDQSLSNKLPFFASRMRWPEAVPTKTTLRLRPPSRDEIVASMANQPPVTDVPATTDWSLNNSQPTSRDRMVDIIRRNFYSDDREGDKYANRVMSILDYSPLGVLNQAYDTGRALGEGRFEDAAMSSVAYLPALRKAPTGLFNPIPKPARSALEDYPIGATLDEEGSITRDIEGRPFDSFHKAGRVRPDEPDQALSPFDIQRVGEQGIEGPIVRNPRGYFDFGVLGETHLRDGKPFYVHVLDSLPETEANIVTAHEVGHVIDQLAGEIPTEGLEDELNFVFSALQTGKERKQKFLQTLPEDFGYSRSQAPRKRMAEAIRAYMVDPNYLKTVASNTARRIREYVNSHPELSQIIQFNSLAAGGALALGMTHGSGESQAQESNQAKGSPFGTPKGADSSFGLPKPFVNTGAKAGSNAIAKVSNTLFRHGFTNQPQGLGKFGPVTRALFDIQSKRKAGVYRGPR